MSKSALKAYLDASKRETRLLGPVEKHLLTRPPDTTRRTDVFHPSEMVREDWCHRASWLAVVAGRKPRPERHNLRTNNIFDEGHYIHAKWQSRIADMGNLYGKWETEDGEIKWGTSLGGRYLEVPLHEDYYRISGHADGWVRGLGDDFLIEIKSVGTGTLRHEAPHLLAKTDNDADKAWDQIRNPFKTHYLQAQMYLWILRCMWSEGLIQIEPPKEAVFIYEWKANQDAKEFVVKYSPDYLTDILDNCKNILGMTEAPECNINPDKGCKKCLSFEEEA